MAQDTHHVVFRFTDAKATDRIAIEADLLQGLGTFGPREGAPVEAPLPAEDQERERGDPSSASRIARLLLESLCPGVRVLEDWAAE